MSKSLSVLALEIEGVMNQIPRTHGHPDVPRLLTIARTHMEIAQLFMEKASGVAMIPPQKGVAP